MRNWKKLNYLLQLENTFCLLHKCLHYQIIHGIYNKLGNMNTKTGYNPQLRKTDEH